MTSLVALIAACRVTALPSPPPPPRVVEMTIADLQRAIREHQTTCHAIVQAYLDRIAAYDRRSGLGSIAVVNPRAIARADEIDRAFARGDRLGPLFCAPILVKDNFDTADLPTTGGSIALASSVPPDDAFMVRKLREADAIVLAKTNMAEWAFSPMQTASSSHGVTANAYALDRVPAGSSGGTASGVAASFGVAGLGSDTGNSIRGPSSHLALFGIRATIGLMSRDGIIPLFAGYDVGGPMTRTVEDGARLFNVLAGYDPADPATALGGDRRARDYTAFLDPHGLRGARVGVLRALVDPADIDADIARLFERAVADLRAAGAEIVDPVEIPRLVEHVEADSWCPTFRHDVGEYLRSLGSKAPVHDVAEVYASGRYAPSAKQRFGELVRASAAAPDRWQPPCLPGLDNVARAAFRADVVAAMDRARVDVLIYPTWAYPPAHLDRAEAEYRGDNSQLIAPPTGMPAATVPMGFSHETLPAGLQLLARPFAEPVLFKLAYAYEQATRHRRPPPAFPELH